MTPITRWFEARLAAPLGRMYRLLDEHSEQLDGADHGSDDARKRKSHHMFLKAA